MSNHLHIENFLTSKIIEIIEDVDPTKFAGVVSDNTSVMVLTKKLVNDQYRHILPIRCIAHHINLLTNNICKLAFAQSTLTKCMKLVHFFKASHQANATLTNEIIENMVKGEGLKGYC